MSDLDRKASGYLLIMSALTSLNLILLLSFWGQVAFRGWSSPSTYLTAALLAAGLAIVTFLVLVQIAAPVAGRRTAILLGLALINGLFLVSASMVTMQTFGSSGITRPIIPGPPESPR